VDPGDNVIDPLTEPPNLSCPEVPAVEFKPILLNCGDDAIAIDCGNERVIAPVEELTFTWFVVPVNDDTPIPDKAVHELLPMASLVKTYPLVAPVVNLIAANCGVAPVFIDCGNESVIAPVEALALTWLAVPANDDTPNEDKAVQEPFPDTSLVKIYPFVAPVVNLIAANCGEELVAIDCGNESVIAPVEALAITWFAVPVIDVGIAVHAVEPVPFVVRSAVFVAPTDEGSVSV
jgi:hypothetical protein